VRLRFGEAPRLFEKHSKVEVRVRIIGRDRDRRLQARDGFQQLPALFLHVRKIVPRRRECRVLSDGHAKALLRTVAIVQFAQDIPEVEIRFRAARRNSEAFAIGIDRLFVALLLLMLLAELKPFL